MNNGRRYGIDVVREFLGRLACGEDIRTLCAALGISVRTGYRWHSNGLDYYTRERVWTPNGRAQRVIDMVKECPSKGFRRIGAEVGITGERVRQIVERAGLLDMRRSAKHESRKRECGVCGTRFSPTNEWSKYCEVHKGGPKRNTPKLTQVCGTCGKQFERLLSNWRPTRPDSIPFCSKSCQGLWVGNNHGFGVHPEHSFNLMARGQGDGRRSS